jgi:hypothetical protein
LDLILLQCKLCKSEVAAMNVVGGVQRERNERIKELGRRIQEVNQERQAAAKPPAPKAKPASSRDRATAYAKASVPRPEPTKSKVWTSLPVGVLD